MRRALALLALIALLAGCGRELASVDLEPVLIQTGDLPPGMEGAQVRSEPPGMFSGVPKYTKAISQQLAQGGQQVGGITVLLYAEAADRDAAYAHIVDGMLDTTEMDVGERAAFGFTDLVFVRCSAVATVRMVGPDKSAIRAYAQRLDGRLKDALGC